MHFNSAEIEQFLRTDTAYILAEMVKANPFDLTDLQRDAWLEEIAILKSRLRRHFQRAGLCWSSRFSEWENVLTR